MEIIKKTTECAFNIDTPDNICIDDNLIKKLHAFAKKNKNITTNNPRDSIKQLQSAYNCDTESCIFKQNEIINYVGHSEIHEQFKHRFKPPGPYNTEDWFSNTHIDSVLKQIEITFQKKKFLYIKFHMIDFLESETELARFNVVDAYNKGIRYFGVVINTDKSSGNGEHWFAIFGDLSKEPFTLEYFNSAGGTIYTIDTWLTDMKNTITKDLHKRAEYVKVVKDRLQYDNHSCGSYSVYYIICRLSGISYDKLNIDDNAMHEVRYHIFRKST